MTNDRQIKKYRYVPFDHVMPFKQGACTSGLAPNFMHIVLYMSYSPPIITNTL